MNATETKANKLVNALIASEMGLRADAQRIIRTERMKLQSAIAVRYTDPIARLADIQAQTAEARRVAELWGLEVK